MRTDAALTISLLAGAAIAIPGFGAFLEWLGSPWLYPSTLVEQVAFALIIIRAVLFFGVPRFRRAKPGTAIILLSADVLVLPVAAVFYFLTGDPKFVRFGGAYLVAWLSAALVVYTPVAGLAIADAIRRRSKLAGVLPAAAGAFVLSSLVLQGVGSASGDQGLSAVARWTIGNLKGQVVPNPELSALLAGLGVLLFASLAAYSVTLGSERAARLVPELAVGVLGIAVLAGWVRLTAGVPTWEAFGLPAAALVGIVWVSTREK